MYLEKKTIENFINEEVDSLKLKNPSDAKMWDVFVALGTEGNKRFSDKMLKKPLRCRMFGCKCRGPVMQKITGLICAKVHTAYICRRCGRFVLKVYDMTPE